MNMAYTQGAIQNRVAIGLILRKGSGRRAKRTTQRIEGGNKENKKDDGS